MSHPKLQAVRNPRTGQVDYSFEVAAIDTVAREATRLRAGQPAWESSGLAARVAVLRRFVAALADRRQTLLEALSADTGRWRIANVEIDSVAGMVERLAGDAERLFAPAGDAPTGFPGIVATPQYVAYPLVGVISPWNFPLILSMIDSIPALMAGCSVLLKPSEVTPRFAVPLLRAVADVPELAAVFGIACGPGSTGEAVIEHVDAVAFTGSVRTGRRVAEAAAHRFIPAYLELGGKDPAVVLPSADVERTAATLLRASVAATGQACQSLERIYVHERIHAALLHALTEGARRVEFNYPDMHRGHIGPLIFAQQATTIREHLADAVAKGAHVDCGGEIVELGGGLYCPATVLSKVDHTMRVMTEETFGPVMPVMPFGDTDEAVRLANDTVYGLSASVFGADRAEAEAVARRINAGAVAINDGSVTAMVHDVEHDAFAFSGLGRSRMGPAGIGRYVRRKGIFVNQGYALDLAAYGEGAPQHAG
jgi:acyl-CoA reductase-like NAD-dependent aldehyde dehydrogenase